MSSPCWMHTLAKHYRQLRARDGEARLLLAFDIDGTILDTRFLVAHVLRAFDREHGTRWFADLRASDVTTHEARVEPLLCALGLSAAQREQVLPWYEAHRMSFGAVREAHRPYHGVLEVIRWFQIQPRTEVALITGRSEPRRAETLEDLNRLGHPYRVTFEDALLHMRGPHARSVAETKREGLRHFQRRGYRVVAVIDNEPENLRAFAEADEQGDVLLLHADTLFETHEELLGDRAVRGRSYDLAPLVRREELPERVEFCWADVGRRSALSTFLASDVRWGELRVRRHLEREELVVGPPREELSLDEALRAFVGEGRAAKLVLEEPGLLEPTSISIRRSGIADDDLWVAADLDLLGAAGCAALARARPNALLGLRADFLVSLAAGFPEEAERLVRTIRSWGVQRLTVQAEGPRRAQAFAALAAWGLELDLEGVTALEAFLRAVLCTPRAITSKFDALGRGWFDTPHLSATEQQPIS